MRLKVDFVEIMHKLGKIASSCKFQPPLFWEFSDYFELVKLFIKASFVDLGKDILSLDKFELQLIWNRQSLDDTPNLLLNSFII